MQDNKAESPADPRTLHPEVAEAIKQAEGIMVPSMPDDLGFNPAHNPDVISLVKQADGNWMGYTQKYGKLVEVRDVGPETVLQLLLTHSGK